MERFKFVGPARLPINATFLTNMWPEYFSFNICTVVHQSELDLSNLDQNWAPTRPTLRRSECVHSFEFFLSDGLPKRIEQLMLLLNPISEKKLFKPSSGDHVSTIAIKTGTSKYDGSSCRAVMEICDRHGNCCQTSPDGRGLDNLDRRDRMIGQTDIYTNTTILGSCAQEVISIFIWIPINQSKGDKVHPFYLQGTFVGDIITAKLTISDPNANDGNIKHHILLSKLLLQDQISNIKHQI